MMYWLFQTFKKSDPDPERHVSSCVESPWTHPAQIKIPPNWQTYVLPNAYSTKMTEHVLPNANLTKLHQMQPTQGRLNHKQK